jgi:hypothetical protein
MDRKSSLESVYKVVLLVCHSRRSLAGIQFFQSVLDPRVKPEDDKL